MKALFKNRFPFVEKSNEELNEDELLIKEKYERYYPKPSKEIAIFEKKETNKLREVRNDESGTIGRGNGSGVSDGDSKDILL